MSRQVGPPKAVAFVLLIFAALFACQVSAKYIKPKPSEFELSLPLACPDTCGMWCTSCPVGRKSDELIDTDEDGNIILNPLPGGTKTAANAEPTSSNKPQTGGILELGDEDVLIPPSLRFRSSHLERFSLSTRQNNDDIIKDGVTRPETWGAGPVDWWRKMNGIIDERGLKVRLDGLSKKTKPEASLHFAAQSSVAASDLGIATGHFWESPSFVTILNVTDTMNPQLMWDVDMQDNSYDEHVRNFFKLGTLDWHNATRISDKYSWVPNSPALTDLVRPGMILDQKSTQWREFRLFLPRHPHRRPPGTVPKYADEFDNLQDEIAELLSIKSSEIIRHAPFYEGTGPVDDPEGPYKPTAWHNTFTYQYGSPEKKDPSNSDADRELRVTWNGEVVGEMSRTWKNHRLQESGKCLLHISIVGPPTSIDEKEDLNLRVRVIKPGKIGGPDELLYGEGHHYKAPYARQFRFGGGPEVVEIPSEKTGLSEPVNFWLTPAFKRINETLSEQLQYSDWHINFEYGKDSEDEFQFMDMETKETNVMCRGGSWHKRMPYTIVQRESLCTFQCD